MIKNDKFIFDWKNLHRNPSIWTDLVPSAWTSKDTLTLGFVSTKVSNDKITIGLRSDNFEFYLPCYYGFDFVIDWEGYRELNIGIADFAPLESDPNLHPFNKEVRTPNSLGKVVGIYFFSKTYGNRANPGAGLRLLYLEKTSRTKNISRIPVTTLKLFGKEVRFRSYAFNNHHFNHNGMEVLGSADISLPFIEEAYYRRFEAKMVYHPKFVPGPVSVSPKGKRYILGAGHVLQWRENYLWRKYDLLVDVVRVFNSKYTDVNTVLVENNGQANEPIIRWDRSGDAYVLLSISGLDDRSAKLLVLLHSPNGDVTKWTVYELPFGVARFEQIVGFNEGAMEYPPVIAITSSEFVKALFIIKLENGVLDLSWIVDVGSRRTVKGELDNIGYKAHSGRANGFVSIGTKVFFVYTRLNQYAQSNMQGADCYVLDYDRATKEFGESTFVGKAGSVSNDVHNWASIAVDGEKHLVVLIGGHNSSYSFNRSTYPSASKYWLDKNPKQISSGKTYPSLICSASGCLHSLWRDTSNSYRFEIVYSRKMPGKNWTDVTIFQPNRSFYNLYMHCLTIDTARNVLFAFFYAEGRDLQTYYDEVLDYFYIHPELGEGHRDRKPTGSRRIPHSQYSSRFVPVGEPVIVISEDEGVSWHVALSSDFN